ncbi:MAG: sigma-70 family RNA polymerase sigma factor [Microcoleus sp. CSU_2_2]|nr:sigma-70 family RNA polymerase sigma factor [Microcoleus sp. SU_5_3]NJS10943.1 sigma-70 family RNA polymerase sigma factor [Microcoleus sp. CSU_2_2]
MEDEIDLRLKRLAVEAQQQPAGSHQRKTALTKLMDEIYRSGTLGHPQRGQYPAGVYEDLYSEALLKTFEYIRPNIDTYDSERPLMGWVNWILNLRFSDATRKYMNQTRRELSIDDLDKIEQESQSDEMNTWVRELIEEDPDGLFRSVSFRERPDITWQDIALAKLNGETFENISERIGLPLTTINSSFNRNLRDFRDYFRNNF